MHVHIIPTCPNWATVRLSCINSSLPHHLLIFASSMPPLTAQEAETADSSSSIPSKYSRHFPNTLFYSFLLETTLKLTGAEWVQELIVTSLSLILNQEINQSDLLVWSPYSRHGQWGRRKWNEMVDKEKRKGWALRLKARKHVPVVAIAKVSVWKSGYATGKRL